MNIETLNKTEHVTVDPVKLEIIRLSYLKELNKLRKKYAIKFTKLVEQSAVPTDY